MRFTLKVDSLANEAFTPGPGPELARMLRAAAERMEAAGDAYARAAEHSGQAVMFTLRDINGNAVGEYGFTPARRKRSAKP